MASTYTQLHVQIVFSVKNRQPLIHEKIRPAIQKYITGIIQNEGCKVLAVYANPDHIHILIGLNPDVSLSSLVRKIKSNSTRKINQSGWVNGRFAWQEGYAAFSYSKRDLDKIIQYIRNQPKHHKKITFREEYLKFLKESGIPYDPKYVF